MFTLTKELTPIIQIFKSPQVQGLVKEYVGQVAPGKPQNASSATEAASPAFTPNGGNNSIGEAIAKAILSNFGAAPGESTSIFSEHGKALLGGISQLKEIVTLLQPAPSFIEQLGQRVLLRGWQKQGLVTDHEMKTAEKALPIGEEHV